MAPYGRALYTIKPQTFSEHSWVHDLEQGSLGCEKATVVPGLGNAVLAELLQGAG